MSNPYREPDGGPEPFIPPKFSFLGLLDGIWAGIVIVWKWWFSRPLSWVDGGEYLPTRWFFIKAFVYLFPLGTFVLPAAIRLAQFGWHFWGFR